MKRECVSPLQSAHWLGVSLQALKQDSWTRWRQASLSRMEQRGVNVLPGAGLIQAAVYVRSGKQLPHSSTAVQYDKWRLHEGDCGSPLGEE